MLLQKTKIYILNQITRLEYLAWHFNHFQWNELYICFHSNNLFPSFAENLVLPCVGHFFNFCSYSVIPNSQSLPLSICLTQQALVFSAMIVRAVLFLSPLCLPFLSFQFCSAVKEPEGRFCQKNCERKEHKKGKTKKRERSSMIQCLVKVFDADSVGLNYMLYCNPLTCIIEELMKT